MMSIYKKDHTKEKWYIIHVNFFIHLDNKLHRSANILAKNFLYD